MRWPDPSQAEPVGWTFLDTDPASPLSAGIYAPATAFAALHDLPDHGFVRNSNEIFVADRLQMSATPTDVDSHASDTREFIAGIRYQGGTPGDWLTAARKIGGTVLLLGESPLPQSEAGRRMFALSHARTCWETFVPPAHNKRRQRLYTALRS